MNILGFYWLEFLGICVVCVFLGLCVLGIFAGVNRIIFLLRMLWKGDEEDE
jgi:hypothetical protein